MGDFGIAMERHEDVAWLEVAGGAGGAGRDFDVVKVEVELGGLAFAGGDGEIEDIRERGGGRGVEADAERGEFLN